MSNSSSPTEIQKESFNTLSTTTTTTTTTCPIYVLNFLRERFFRNIENVEEFRSAQQQVWIVTLSEERKDEPQKQNNDEDDVTNSTLWNECLHMGNNHVVIRQWNGGCQWWNLHQNASPRMLAKMELQGYHLANLAMREHGSFTVRIPRILYNELDASDRPAWAILEYVGPHSKYFDETTKFAAFWMDCMVKRRHEFGFEEPHPRWGRVPEDRALEYANLTLEQALVPLHLGSATAISNESSTAIAPSVAPFKAQTYQSMILLYQQAYGDVMKYFVSMHYCTQDSLSTDQVRWNRVLELIQEAVQETLPSNLAQIPQLLPPFPHLALVHMDLQPQNLLVASSSSQSTSSFKISSVLDWEDATIADPRFDIMLLCRKVCANRSQAEQVWKQYAENFMAKSQQEVDNRPGIAASDSSGGDSSIASSYLGPLLPWLQLEAIHSLLTLSLQSMNMLNGGRNPWETSKDLWGKMEREISRWHAMKQEELLEQAALTILTPQANKDKNISVTGTSVAKSPAEPDIEPGNDKCEDEDYLATLGIHPEKCYRPN